MGPREAEALCISATTAIPEAETAERKRLLPDECTPGGFPPGELRIGRSPLFSGGSTNGRVRFFFLISSFLWARIASKYIPPAPYGKTRQDPPPWPGRPRNR